MKNIYILFILTICVLNLSVAQTAFTRWDSIAVIEFNNTLNHPFAGGFNNPQFSDIDLDGDGIKDLFVFDRSTTKAFTFINGGDFNKVDYKYAPEFRNKFPLMIDWVLLVDYNCDGKEDLFTGNANSIIIYRNDYSTIDGLKFTYIKTLVDTQVYVASTDIPAINDIDGDNDIDILTFEPGGSAMYYYENMSIDNFGVCDSLQFVLTDQCWGKFMEAFGNCSVSLGITCIGGGISDIERSHAGSTSLAIDLNNDNVKELIIGDLSCNNAYMLTNGGTPNLANMIAHDSLYPALSPVEIHRFPATFYEDVDNDGLKDLLAAPNGKNVSENFTSSWYYKNIGTTTVPNFSFQSSSFLQNEMIEVGEGANPVFFDYNADSLLDLIIGNYGYYSPTGTYPSKLLLYENIGSKNKPIYNLVTRDYSNLGLLNLNGLYPAFGDMDNDGDMDMIVGDYNGELHYFDNTGGVGNPANFVLTQPLYMGIDIGQFATPQIVDVDRDGKLDLIIGERSGTLNYFENVGTVTAPIFTSAPTNNFFGGIDVMIPCCTGYSSPFLTALDSSGSYSLLVGTEIGFIYHYTNIDGNINGIFTLTDTLFGNINEGNRASISGGDLNNKGTVDLVLGNYGGGITIFQNSSDTILPIIPPPDTLPVSITIFPNPSTDNLFIQITGLVDSDFAELYVHNVLGQIVYNRKLTATFNQWNIPLDVSAYAQGLYFLKVETYINNSTHQSSAFVKFVVNR